MAFPLRGVPLRSGLPEPHGRYGPHRRKADSQLVVRVDDFTLFIESPKDLTDIGGHIADARHSIASPPTNSLTLRVDVFAHCVTHDALLPQL